MNTLQELRETLGREAASVHGESSVARVAAVRGRARSVRRRRTAGGVVAAALMVGGIGTLALLPGSPDRGPEPADLPVVDGHTARASIESLRSTYAFDEVHTGTDRVRVELPASNEPRLVSWAGEGPLTVRSDYTDADRSGAAADFSDHTLVPPGDEHAVTVGGRGEIAVAVYDLQERAPGDYRDGVAFPDVVDGTIRVDSVIGDPGQTDLTVETTMPERTLALRDVCSTTVDRGLEVHVSVDGEDTFSSECGPGAVGGIVSGGTVGTPQRDAFPAAGEPVTLRVWVTAATRGLRTPDRAIGSSAAPDLRLALAAYEVAEPAAAVPGWEVPPTVERDGHVWAYVEHTTRDGGFTMRPDLAAPYLASVFVGAEPEGLSSGDEQRVQVVWDGVPGTSLSFDTSTVVGTAYGPQDRRIRLLAPAGTPISVAVYRRVD